MTDAGIAACFTADGLGLAAAIQEIALGDVGWVPTGAATALQSERVRVSISGGEIVAGSLQLHITAFVSAGTPEFWVRELGVFLDDGTLLAVWSTADDALLYRSELADTLLTFDLVLSGIPAGSITIIEVGSLYLAQGTTSRIGGLRLATHAEVQAGAPNTPAVEPSGLHALLSNLRLYPEIETADHRLVVAAGTASVVLGAGQSWLWRGFRRYSTDDWALVNRTFATSASKTYHLRWRHATGLALLDLASAGYNPSSLAETDPAFDSQFDDMLIARVVTNSSNVATVASRANGGLRDDAATETVVVLDTPGTTDFTVPTNVRAVEVELWGAGGGACFMASPNQIVEGGGAGGYAAGSVAVTPGQVISCTVGAPGYGGTAAAPGAAGGSTSFGVHLSATGGLGGTNGGTPGAGGTGVGGQINLVGQPGGNGTTGSLTATGGSAPRGGYGGGSLNAAAGWPGGGGGGAYPSWAQQGAAGGIIIRYRRLVRDPRTHY